MITRDKKKIQKVRQDLFDQLKEEKVFWSYDPKSVKEDRISDEQLISLTLRHLDLPQIKQLFSIFSYKKIKDTWKRLLVPEGEYLHTLNRFIAWYYFGAKNPDAYLKTLETRHFNSLPKL